LDEELGGEEDEEGDAVDPGDLTENHRSDCDVTEPRKDENTEEVRSMDVGKSFPNLVNYVCAPEATAS
jgi:hypothetical protein